jgi:transposase-like protein
MLSEKQNMKAVKQFFKQAVAVVGHAPEQVTTDGHRCYPRAIRETMGDHVQHRTNKYLNNPLEQDHRGIKQRYHLMCSFGTFEQQPVSVVTRDELRNYLRPHRFMGETISLSERRQVFLNRLVALQTLLQAAS